MNIEDRLRSAFGRRADEVEVSPGALFEIQRRVVRRRRMPELRLRPALVLAAAACAAIAVTVSISITGQDQGPEVRTASPVASPPDVAPTVVPSLPEPPAVNLDGAPEEPTETASSATEPRPLGDSAQIITTSPSGPTEPEATSGPPARTPPSDPAPAPDADIGAETIDVVDIPTPECSTQPEADGSGGDDTGADGAGGWVTVYFACGGSSAAPRLRPAGGNDLTTALAVLLDGPNEADRAAGFEGLGGIETAAVTAINDRWATIDFPTDLAWAFGSDGGLNEGGLTARQFVEQLNSTVFQFPEIAVAEYRIGGRCADFGALLNEGCRIHIRDGDGVASRTSTLTAHTIGTMDSTIRAAPDDGAVALGYLQDGSRITEAGPGGGPAGWVPVATTAGDLGWVSTQTIVAQPLEIDPATAEAMASLAWRLTQGTGLGPDDFAPAGLVLRWGADDGDVTVVPTSGIDTGWWHRPMGGPSPISDSPDGKPAELLWLNGDGAVTTINRPGPFGEPHRDFAPWPTSRSTNRRRHPWGYHPPYPWGYRPPWNPTRRPRQPQHSPTIPTCLPRFPRWWTRKTRPSRNGPRPSEHRST